MTKLDGYANRVGDFLSRVALAVRRNKGCDFIGEIHPSDFEAQGPTNGEMIDRQQIDRLATYTGKKNGLEFEAAVRKAGC